MTQDNKTASESEAIEHGTSLCLRLSVPYLQLASAAAYGKHLHPDSHKEASGWPDPGPWEFLSSVGFNCVFSLEGNILPR
ncbi:hypothetical protein ACFX13_026522 [Malus domestica]